MKKTLSIMLALTFMYGISNAQFSKGTVMLGTTIGTANYGSSNSDYDYAAGNSRTTGAKNFTFTAGPQAGIFLNPRLVLGVTSSVSFSNGHVTNTSLSSAEVQTGSKTHSKTTTVNIGPYLRDYFAQLNSNNWLYLQVNGAVGTGRGSTSDNSYTSISSTSSAGKVSGIFNWSAGGSVGLTHLFYKRVGMDVAVGYAYSHQHQKDANTSSTVNKNTGATAENSTNYTLNSSNNDVNFGAGLHWFLRG